MYKHSENTIDPRDKKLISYSKRTKRFVCEESDLKARGINPTNHYFTIGIDEIIFLWSEKYQLHICYRHLRNVKNADEIIAKVYVPYFSIILNENDNKAHHSSLGTELHILND